MGYCKDCIFYSSPIGSEGRWKVCASPKMRVANVYNDVKNLPEDGVGYSDSFWSKEFAELYVGALFGCIHFSPLKK